jgi:hypothetical protein
MKEALVSQHNLTHIPPLARTFTAAHGEGRWGASQRRASRILAVAVASFAALAVCGISGAQADDDFHFVPTPTVSVDYSHQLVALDPSMFWMPGGGQAHLTAGLTWWSSPGDVSANDRIKVYDDTTYIGQCKATQPGTCHFTVTSTQAKTRHFRAYIAPAGANPSPPTVYSTVSAPVSVDWSTPIVLNTEASWLSSGQTATLTATKAASDSGAITFWEMPANGWGTGVKLPAPNCVPGALVCSIEVAHSNLAPLGEVHKYVAKVSGRHGAPTKSSPMVTVRWNDPPAPPS